MVNYYSSIMDSTNIKFHPKRMTKIKKEGYTYKKDFFFLKISLHCHKVNSDLILGKI